MEKKRIIFISGASRSGTTMINTVLGRHSIIYGLQELHFFGDVWNLKNDLLSSTELEHMAAKLYARQKRSIWNSQLSKKDYESAKILVQKIDKKKYTGSELFCKFVQEVADKFCKKMVSEHTPRNIFYAKSLLELYSEAKVVHIIRDPRAVLSSQKNRWKMKSHGSKNMPWREVVRVWVNYNPFTISKLWKETIKVASEIEGHLRFKLIRFEDVVTNPRKEIQSLCKFIGIDYEENMINVQHVSSSHLKYKHRTGIIKDNIDIWKDTLTIGEIAISEWMTKAFMQKNNYKSYQYTKSPLLSIIKQIACYPLHLFGMIIINPNRIWIHIKAILRHAKI